MDDQNMSTERINDVLAKRRDCFNMFMVSYNDGCMYLYAITYELNLK